ncbi:GlsB/YeaQ/YmgE family stress response membrane protein [Longispora albida]|uniref:GlsB/YeaQ/YmgE family stress response membrane protein n=1 Tax=Longispora albida TaxID=203523 RepID=UPI00036A34E1|nr:hypothetical protein [Longispora albida]
MGRFLEIVVSAIFFGAIIGALGRLLLPGKQSISIAKTIGVGIAAAFVGSLLAWIFGVDETKGIDWIQWALQIGLAMIGVALVAGTAKRS